MDTKKLRQKILDLAIRGKLVPQDPNDEPASVLLERIRAEKERLTKEGKIKRSKKSTSDTSHNEHEAPFEIPDSWEWVSLRVISNYGNCENVDVNEIPGDGWILELEDLEKDSAKITQYLTKDERDIKGVRHSFHKGDILYSKLRTYLNKVLVANENGFCTTEIIPITCSSFVLPEYINHVLRSKYFVDYTIQCCYGVKMPRLSTTDACNGQIPLPPYNEQKRIATTIEDWFQLIDLMESDKVELNEYITKAKSKILELAIHGKLVPQDPNDEPAIELLKRINPEFEAYENEEDGDLPDGWTFCRLEDIVDYEQPQAYIVQSTEYSPKYKTPVLTAGKSFIIGYTNEEEGICSNLPVIIFDDFTTESKYVDFPFKVKSSAMKILHVKEGVNIQYVCHFMSVTKLIGDTHKRYWISEYSKMVIPLPPYQEQLRIVSKIEELFAVLDDIKESLE